MGECFSGVYMYIPVQYIGSIQANQLNIQYNLCTMLRDWTDDTVCVPACVSVYVFFSTKTSVTSNNKFDVMAKICMQFQSKEH